MVKMSLRTIMGMQKFSRWPTVTIFPIAKHYYSLQVPLLMHNAKIIMCRYLNNRCIT